MKSEQRHLPGTRFGVSTSVHVAKVQQPSRKFGGNVLALNYLVKTTKGQLDSAIMNDGWKLLEYWPPEK